MLKVLINNIRFISNTVKRIQSFEKRMKFFEYLQNAIASSGLFIYSRHTPSYMMKKKNGMTSLKENSFSQTVKALLAESLLVS